jgi:hypothetical protein
MELNRIKIKPEVFSKQWWSESFQLAESSPLAYEDDDLHEYVNDQLSAINKAAAEFNFPIDDLQYAFNAGQNLILNDDVWSKLENTNSYSIESIGQAILYAKQHNIDIDPYIQLVNNLEPLPLPLVLRYEADKYYLVAGELVLSIYRALRQTPAVLQATLNLQVREQLEPESEPESQGPISLLDEFINFVSDGLQLKELPKIMYSDDIGEVKEKCSFAHYDPNSFSVLVYIGDRNMADCLRSLGHEMVHHKQNEEGRITDDSGETGSEIENEANSKAGIFLRDFGKKHNDIYDAPIKQYLK